MKPELTQLAYAADASAAVARLAAAEEWRLALAGERALAACLRQEGRHLAILHRNASNDTLSLRQTQILLRLCAGMSLKQIAGDVGVSLATVSHHIQESSRKLGHESPMSIVTTLAPWAALAHGRVGDLDAINPKVTALDFGLESAIVVGFAPRANGRAKSLGVGEREVAELAIRGFSNHAIAAMRQRSYRTVANQLAGLFQKFGVHSRVELACQLGAG